MCRTAREIKLWPPLSVPHARAHGCCKSHVHPISPGLYKARMTNGQQQAGEPSIEARRQRNPTVVQIRCRPGADQVQTRCSAEFQTGAREQPTSPTDESAVCLLRCCVRDSSKTDRHRLGANRARPRVSSEANPCSCWEALICGLGLDGCRLLHSLLCRAAEQQRSKTAKQLLEYTDSRVRAARQLAKISPKGSSHTKCFRTVGT
jgi:hypothetical protein